MRHRRARETGQGEKGGKRVTDAKTKQGNYYHTVAKEMGLDDMVHDDMGRTISIHPVTSTSSSFQHYST